MAYTVPRARFLETILNTVQRVAVGFFDTLINLAESNSRLRRIETLKAMSDKELSELGLKREDIVPHVFGYAF